MSKYDYQNRSWTEIAAAIEAGAVAFIPVGSTEAHGPHLPLATDSIISLEMARRACALLEKEGVRGLVLPVISYSVTDFSKDFPGTISISAETARRTLEEVCLALIAQGFRRVCVANSHLEPAHVETIKSAAIAVEEKTGLKVCFPDKRRRRWAERLTEEFKSGACHAGRYESSLVMAAEPELVREELMRSLPPNEISLSQAILEGKKSFREAGGEMAYFGSPAEASADEGDATYQTLAEMLLEALKEAYPDEKQP